MPFSGEARAVAAVRWLAPLLGFLLIGPVSGVAAADYDKQRRAMVRAIQEDVVATSHYIGVSEFRPDVMAAMATVPRHRFVPVHLRSMAYANRPLPIGHGQTISQPYIVALMTHLLEPRAGQRVLEIGTGSGYQAAVLAELGLAVYSMEIVEPLALEAGRRLPDLGYGSVQVRHGDGYHGWPEAGPFDAIIVTAVATHLPPPLLDQLRPGGRMVLPVGNRFSTQQLVLVTKDEDGRLQTRQLLPVRFVPLTGGHD